MTIFDPVIRGGLRRLLTVLGAGMVLAGCSQEAPRPIPPKVVKAFVVGSAVEAPEAPTTSARMAKDPAMPAFDVAGRVLAVLVQEGDVVSDGQALARLDPLDMALSESSARTQLVSAQSERDAAEANFQRFADLRQKGFISQAEFERRESEVKAARAKFEATSDALGYATLRALAPGRVQSVLAKPGMMVAPREVVVILQLGADARLSMPRSLERRGARTSAMMVPLASVINGEAVYRLVPIDPSLYRIERVAIKTGRMTERAVEVVAGLSTGDRIVAAGTHVLTEGETVRLLAPR